MRIKVEKPGPAITIVLRESPWHSVYIHKDPNKRGYEVEVNGNVSQDSDAI